MIEQYYFTKMIPNYPTGAEIPEDYAIEATKRDMAEELVRRFADIKIEKSDRGDYTIVKAKIGIEIPEDKGATKCGYQYSYGIEPVPEKPSEQPTTETAYNAFREFCDSYRTCHSCKYSNTARASECAAKFIFDNYNVTEKA